MFTSSICEYSESFVWKSSSTDFQNRVTQNPGYRNLCRAHKNNAEQWKNIFIIFFKFKAWNAYPYTKTRYTFPVIGDRLNCEIETLFIDDAGTTENLFRLSSEERRNYSIGMCHVHIYFATKCCNSKGGFKLWKNRLRFMQYENEDNFGN